MEASDHREPGSSFGPEDPRTHKQRLEDLRRIYEQVGNISRQQGDAAVRADLLRLLRERRKPPEHGGLLGWFRRRPTPPAGMVQFDPVPDPQGGEVLVVPAELLMRADALELRHVPPLLEAYKLRPKPIACLQGRVVRLRSREADGGRMVEIAGALRARGVPLSLNYVAPMGIVMKGLGGPEKSSGAGPARPPAGPGTPVQVAIIDTGIAAAQRADGWLTGLVQPDNVDPLDALPRSDGYLDLGAGHGQFVAGVVQQVAPGARLRIYKALDSDGIGSEVEAACAMVRAADEGARVINLSLGMETLNDQPPVVFEIALDLIEERARETGEILVVAAAGNFGHPRACWPAASERVIAVGGLTQGLEPAEWSSRGDWVDVSTMAEGVRSTYVKGKEHPRIDPQPEEFRGDPWAVWTGTSFAAPQVAGAVADIAQRQGVGPREALDRLLARGREVPNYGRAVRILPRT
jgi:Subtilase family